ncbi:MAG: GtrA family protein [Oscillibacter sp.]|jgi:putative flippase GtrA|nr:GtrA family protein [Oscillibacter sp.]
MKRKLIDGTMPRFLLAGIVNTLAGCGTMFLLYNLAGCSYLVSSAANYIVGGIVSFFLNKYFTFRRREWSWGQVWRFALNVAVCYGLAYGAAKPLAVMALADTPKDIQENVAMLIGMCLYVALNYFGQRFFAFR